MEGKIVSRKFQNVNNCLNPGSYIFAVVSKKTKMN